MAANTNNANSNSSTGTVVGNQAKPISSARTQIVLGESELIAAGSSLPSPSSPSTAVIAQPVQAVEGEGVENGSGTNGNAGKKPVWSRPSNVAAGVGSVMGGQWPALSESARVSSKPPSDSPKILSDGSSSPSSSSSSVVSQGTGNASFSSQKLASNNVNSNSTPNHTMPVRQRSMKRGGASSNGSLSQLPPPPPPGSAVEAPLNSPSRDHAQRTGFILQSHSGNDHPQHRNSYRNRNGGPHPRGDGSHTQNYGRRRNQDHGNQDWNNHRNLNGRDAHLQPQRGFPRLRHGPPPPPALPTTPQYMAHPPSQPFGTPIGFPEFSPSVYYVPIQAHPDSLRGVPFIAPMPSVFFHPPDLHAKIVSQIDYYFSNENLIKDTFLRQNMDLHGWVSIKLIAGFKKVLHLTEDIPLILDAVQRSTVVEVQGDKLRRRNDWKRWIMPPSAVQFTNISSPRSGGNSSPDMLTDGIQNISLDQNAINQGGSMNQENVHAESLAGRSSSGDLNNLLPSSSEGVADNA
ncbi:hypothetical protein SLE2022_359640 [Rubroshorea leprosula]